MANKNKPCGFEPHGHIKEVAVLVAGAAIYPGEFVRMANTGLLAVCAAGETIMGLCLDYASASGVSVRVSVDPEQLYIGQAHGSAVDVQSDIGNVADILATAHNTSYKASRHEFDDSTLATSSAGLLLVGLMPDVDNAFGANAKVIVKINEHQAFGADAFAGI